VRGVVAKRTSNDRYGVNQAVVRYSHFMPDGSDDLVSVYCPVPVSDEIGERIESARGQRNLFIAFLELSAS
jgi:hypothetical protein